MIEPEYLIERKKQKLQIRNWKFFVFVLLLLVTVMFVRNCCNISRLGSVTNALKNEDYIGLVSFDGILYEDLKRDEKLEKIAEDDKVKALIVQVNSPGGTIVGAEKIYNILKKISNKKPVVTVMGSVAASGGYLISLASNYIISHNGTITGSIGVIFQTAEVTTLAEKLGIKFENFKSGHLKAMPNPTEKLTPEAHEATMQSVMDIYEYFTELVSIGRNIPIDQVKQIADGRVYTGRQALKLKLVDAIGTKDTAIEWLRNVKKLSSDLKISEIKFRNESRVLEALLDNMDSLSAYITKNMHSTIKALY